MSENFEYYLRRLFLANNLIDFVAEKVRKVRLDSLMTTNNKPVLQMGFNIFLFLILRKIKKDKVPKFYSGLRELLRNSVEIASWFIKNITNEEFFKEFFIECYVMDMKCLVTGLIMAAVETVMDVQGLKGEQLFVPESEGLGLVKALLFMVVDVAIKFKEQDRYLVTLYRLINFLSKYPVLASAMCLAKVPEVLLYLTGAKEFEGFNKLVHEEPPQVLYEKSEFAGYLELDPTELKNRSIAVIEWEKKEAKYKAEFVLNYSYIIAAAFRLVTLNRDTMENVTQKIIAKKTWYEILIKCQSRESRRLVAQLVYAEIKDDTKQVEELLNHLQAVCQRDDLDLATLKSTLSLIRHFFKAEEESIKKRGVKMLNALVGIESSIRTEFFDYFLGYLFRMLKCNAKFFEKMGKEGKTFTDDLIRKVAQYYHFTIKECARLPNKVISRLIADAQRGREDCRSFEGEETRAVRNDRQTTI
jgi:hypothetical protein